MLYKRPLYRVNLATHRCITILIHYFNTGERVGGTSWDTSDDIENSIQSKLPGENIRGELSRCPQE